MFRASTMRPLSVNSNSLRRFHAMKHRVNVMNYVNRMYGNHCQIHNNFNYNIHNISVLKNQRQVGGVPRSINHQPKRHFFDTVQATIQSGIMSWQTMTGLPWWATIASSTIIVRTALFPLVRSQIIHFKKLNQCVPELNFLMQLLRERLRGLSSKTKEGRQEIAKVLRVFFKGVNASLKMHDAKLSIIFGLPLINLAVFMAFIMSIRDMITGDHEFDAQFTEELFWLDGLHMRDKALLLPIGAITMSYLALELSFAGTVATRFTLLLKDFLQCGMIMFLPFVSQLPSGVFFYWIPSTIMGMLQTRLLRMPLFMRLMRIPTTPAVQAGVAAGASTTSTATAAAVASTSVEISASQAISASTASAVTAVGAAVATNLVNPSLDTAVETKIGESSDANAKSR